MPPKIPTPVPQVPVRDLDRAISFYRSRLGFALDWKFEDGIAGVSRDEARLFLDRVAEGPLHPIRVWLNLDSVSEVDALHRAWYEAGVEIVSPPEHNSHRTVARLGRIRFPRNAIPLLNSDEK